MSVQGVATGTRALVVVLLLAFVLVAASPSPSPPQGGDPRSAGEGPGLVGEPALAILAVLAIGLGSAAATVLYVRLTGGSHGSRRPGP